MRFLRLWVRPTLVVMRLFLRKWLNIQLSYKLLVQLSLCFIANFQSKTGEFRSGFSNQPLSSRAFFRVEQPPTTMNIFVSDDNQFLLINKFLSVIVGTYYFYDFSFLARNSSEGPSILLLTSYCYFFSSISYFSLIAFSSSSYYLQLKKYKVKNKVQLLLLFLVNSISFRNLKPSICYFVSLFFLSQFFLLFLFLSFLSQFFQILLCFAGFC